MERALGNHRPYFDLDGFRVIVEEERGDAEPVAEATVRLQASRASPSTRPPPATARSTRSTHALRKALDEFYPNLREMRCSTTRSASSTSTQGHGGQDARADHLRRRRRDVGHGGRGRQHHRGLLAGARGLHRVQAPPRRAQGQALNLLPLPSGERAGVRGAATVSDTDASDPRQADRGHGARADGTRGHRHSRPTIAMASAWPAIARRSASPASSSTRCSINWDIATAERRPMCADTGLPRYYVKLGNEAAVEGGLRRARARAPARDRGGHGVDSRSGPTASTR